MRLTGPCLRRRRGWGPDSLRRRSRTGIVALDYVLVLCVVLPLVAFILGVAPRIMNLVYQMIDMLVTWPFM
jgi:hypothetical protein